MSLDQIKWSCGTLFYNTHSRPAISGWRVVAELAGFTAFARFEHAHELADAIKEAENSLRQMIYEFENPRPTHEYRVVQEVLESGAGVFYVQMRPCSPRKDGDWGTVFTSPDEDEAKRHADERRGEACVSRKIIY